MNLINKIRKLCTPAYVYLVISVIAMVAMMVQNGGKSNEFCVGVHSCEVENKGAIFIAQALYTVFWVFVLDAICRSGHKNISWFLVLLPYILFFIMVAMFILGTGNSNHRGFMEGMENKDKDKKDSKDHDKDKKDKDKKDHDKKDHSKDHDKDHSKDHSKDHNKDKKESFGAGSFYAMIDGSCKSVNGPQGASELFSDAKCQKKANNIG